MTDQINVGLVGFGMAARVFHAPVIQSVPSLKLKAIVERHGDTSRNDYPGIEVVRDVSSLLQDEQIDLVVVATPNISHFDLARQSLLANKHVVVEKPFTNTSAEAQQLIELAGQQNRIISVNQNRRWDGDFQTIKKLIAARLLGRLVDYEAHFDRFRNPPRQNVWKEQEGPGSGILFDLGSHLIDQAQVLFGLPRMLTADIRVQRDGGRVVDNFELLLHYDDLKVTLRGGMLVRELGPRFTLHGTEGSFLKYGFDPQEEALNQGRTPDEPHWGEDAKDLWGTLNTQVAGLHIQGRVETIPGRYQTFYENIADAIKGRTELAVRPEEARNTIRMIELAMQSHEEKRTVPFSQ